jgi:hypothetical protein
MRTLHKLSLFQLTLRRAALGLAAGSLLTLNACQRPADSVLTPQQSIVTSPTGRLAAPVQFYALTDGNQLLLLNSDNTASPLSTVSVTGLGMNERLVAIDFRPATGQLYGLTNASRLYIINQLTGTATALGTGPFSPALTGDVTAFDFNPTVDRIRVVTNQGLNLRLNPETGTTAAIDGTINGVAGAAISGAAYTNNFAGATTTVLYDIDPVTDRLYRQDPPNNGTLAVVGSLGVDVVGASGFDIAPNGAALATLGRSGFNTELYEINLATGLAEKVGDLPTTSSIIGLAIPTAPVAYAVDGFNRLMIFDPTTSAAPIMKAITGLQSGEMLVGIDFRPANAQLYGVSNQSRIYTINTSSGAVAMIGGGPFSPAVEGVDIGMDFNPTVDRIRLVSSTGQNLRLHPDLGTVVATDGRLNPGSPSITGAAYTNNFAGATTTTLFNIDSMTDQLTRQVPPNDGTQQVVGSLGVNVEGANGFDIGGTTGNAYALLRTGNQSRVYQINLTTGAATPGMMFPALVQGMAVGLGF